MKRTYSLGIEELLDEWYAICSGLAAPCGGTSEDIAVFEGEWDRLLLDSSGTRKAEVCEGTKDERGEQIRKRRKCLQLGLLRLRFSHLLSTVTISCKFQCKNRCKNRKPARDMLFRLLRCRGVGIFRLDRSSLSRAETV